MEQGTRGLVRNVFEGDWGNRSMPLQFCLGEEVSDTLNAEGKCLTRGTGMMSRPGGAAHPSYMKGHFVPALYQVGVESFPRQGHAVREPSQGRAVLHLDTPGKREGYERSIMECNLLSY